MVAGGDGDLTLNLNTCSAEALSDVISRREAEELISTRPFKDWQDLRQLAGVTMNSQENEEIIVKLHASGVTIGSDPSR